MWKHKVFIFRYLLDSRIDLEKLMDEGWEIENATSCENVVVYILKIFVKDVI